MSTGSTGVAQLVGEEKEYGTVSPLCVIPLEMPGVDEETQV